MSTRSSMARFLVLAAAASLAFPTHAAADVLVELHFKPVENAQIAIWITDANGTVVQEVLVTQATATLGIGNRPGHWDFLSSWRFPYGPRPQVLPVWAHARGRDYPQLRFFDDDEGDFDSLGWHENSSSIEPFFCRPLTAEENQTISLDTMTCPSPAMFKSDKGRFDGDKTSVYPPRGDLIKIDPVKDSEDVADFAGLNDLDAVSAATPEGGRLELVTTMLPTLADAGPLTAWIEINLEHDENPDWSFDRELDHLVDIRLPNHGIEYLGQPSVVYRLEFDPNTPGFTSTDAYAGYGDWQGLDGALNPPDSTISTSDGSGADRLGLCTTTEGEMFRFGVYTHGPDGPAGSVTSVDCEGGGPTGGCTMRTLPPPAELSFDAIAFNRVAIDFTLPMFSDGTEIRSAKVWYRPGDMPITETNLASAVQRTLSDSNCLGVFEPGATVSCELDQLFGNFTYQVGLVLEDSCSNTGELVSGEVTTPRQDFQTVEGACFVATAAWGAPWSDRVAALRFFRDAYLRQSGVGHALLSFYYANSPMLAQAVAPRPWARALARGVLAPLADLASAATLPIASEPARAR